MFRSSNPALNANIFAKERSLGAGEAMTIQGTVNKIFIMLFLIVMSASYVWGKVMQPVGMFETEEAMARNMASVMPFMIGGGIIGFLLVIVSVFNAKLSPIIAPAYAIAEGFLLGGVSAFAETRYPGIAIQAVALTLGTAFCLMTLFKSGVIRVTDKFKRIAFTAFGAIFMIYMLNFIMGFFGSGIPGIFAGGPVGIGFSLLVVGIASAMLVIDFDRIVQYSSSAR